VRDCGSADAGDERFGAPDDYARPGYGAPFIFITAFPDETTRARALKAGAICFLSKPFAGPTLINYLGVALEGH
jgi:FixJ family two-component response regulator